LCASIYRKMKESAIRIESIVLGDNNPTQKKKKKKKKKKKTKKKKSLMTMYCVVSNRYFLVSTINRGGNTTSKWRI
jgi:hypothetical protein